MATHATNTTTSKPSFASIAARAPSKLDGQPVAGRENDRPSKASSPSRSSKASAAESPSASQLHRELQHSMSRLAVKDSALASNALNDQQKSNISRAGLRVDDDQTQVSSSSTKPASLDGKSTTSGNTYALDEKESLRPDDSASVKAAEEEDFGSGPASGAQNSRVGSEAGSRAFRDQFYEISESIGSGPHRVHPFGRRTIGGIEEEGPQMTRAPLVSALPAPVDLPRPEVVAANGPPIDYDYKEPDQKLFEALQSQKDRSWLLGLERTVVGFVNDPKKPPLIDLPPCNSFCRLLTHKLADYYALTHFVDNAVSSVRLYRTPYCQLRTPLSELAKAQEPTETTPASQPAMKIMRRAGMNKYGQITESGPNTTDSSIAPSKAGSENEDDSQRGTGVASPTDSNVTKDKSAMTREEREAKYKETRERIFGPESENADTNETVNEVSRTSSRNEKKKKKYKNNDDGFAARSQFNVCFPQMQYPGTSYDQTASLPAYFGPYAVQQGNGMGQSESMGAAMLQQGYQQGYQSMAGVSAYPTTMAQNPMIGMHEAQNHPAGYTSQVASQFYQPVQQGVNTGHHSPVMSSPAMNSNGHFSQPQSQLSDQQWTQNTYPYFYQQPREQQQFYPPQTHSPNAMASVTSVPYQFGQLPLQPSMPGARTQHPLPGSYKSQSFNPQTRAFVPTNGSVHSQTGSYGSSPSHMVRGPAMSFQNGNQYSSYGQQASIYPQTSMTSTTYTPSQEPKTYGTRKSSVQSNVAQSPAQSSLSKWGTPSHLPPKPPPTEALSFPEAQHSLPINNQFNVNIQPMSAGQPMPSFQNGIYTMPGSGSQTT